MTELWNSVLGRLSDKIAPHNFEMWLRPISCRGIEGQTITLEAPNSYVRLWFESNYLSIVLDELSGDTGLSYQVEFLPEPEDKPPLVLEEPSKTSAVDTALAESCAGRPVLMMATPSDPGGSPPASPPPSGGGGSRGGHGGGGPGLGRVGAATDEGDLRSLGCMPMNPRYTFDTFVAGPSNQLAYAASQAAANHYPPKYNPIFLCGGVGLGKTHLLHAIGHEYSKNREGARILYLSGEHFMNEYIHAIRNNKMHDFRRRYREGCDVLLVDDIQFLAGKDGTQDEFFHTFNALHNTHRQIVLTADRKPHEISDIADRLRTRFAWGLLADIEPPDLEMRVAILRKKAAADSIYLPDQVALYVATAVKSNVRELEGALIRLAASASLMRRDITIEFARESLEGSITRAREHLTTDAVIKAVAGYYGLKVSDIKSSRRHKAVAGPRAVAMYLARTHTSDSYPDLGRAFGGKHHTTVISAVEKIASRLKDDPGLRSELHAIESVLLRS
ncbi:chromosomal replication initiator protein DnaA [Haliangium sp.]|uniref:chromosomal replication initiator protein DnaA n=1 Tax=Haliangium sp. TaxID=2663208 RepID=UPI003D097C2B